jgi:glycosyltransferase involved in cell wall biosynthesis
VSGAEIALDSMNEAADFMQEPLVTVGLAVFNAGPALALSVQSVLRQSWGNWELLILDDGSTDGAIDRLPCLFDTRIIVVRDGCNRGLSARLYQAASMATGKYFARMDQDDICHPERFKKQVTYLENHPEVDLLATQCITMDEQEQLNGTLPSAINHEDICRRPWQGFYMAHPTWMGRTDWFRRNPYPIPGPYCCEDQELLLRAHQVSCYHTLPERLLAYRVRSHVLWQKLFRTHAAMLKIQLRYFLARGRWLNALLSGLIALARIGRDGFSELREKLSFPAKVRWSAKALPDELREWEGLIKTLKDSVRYSDDNKVKDGKA